MGKFELVKNEQLELRGSALCCDNMNPLSSWTQMMQITTIERGWLYIVWDIYQDDAKELYAIPILDYEWQYMPYRKVFLRKGRDLKLKSFWPYDPEGTERRIDCLISICIS